MTRGAIEHDTPPAWTERDADRTRQRIDAAPQRLAGVTIESDALAHGRASLHPMRRGIRAAA